MLTSNWIVMCLGNSIFLGKEITNSHFFFSAAMLAGCRGSLYVQPHAQRWDLRPVQRAQAVPGPGWQGLHQGEFRQRRGTARVQLEGLALAVQLGDRHLSFVCHHRHFQILEPVVLQPRLHMQARNKISYLLNHLLYYTNFYFQSTSSFFMALITD